VANVQKHARGPWHGDHQGTGPRDGSTGVIAHKSFVRLVRADIGRGRRGALQCFWRPSPALTLALKRAWYIDRRNRQW
jgi:hypothetical protein